MIESDELEAALRAVGDDDFGRVHRAIILAAAMSGLRMGELRALRWIDVDWQAQRIRVRRSYVQGHLGTPKSRRGFVAFRWLTDSAASSTSFTVASVFQAEDDLVFGNPHTGMPKNGTSPVTQNLPGAIWRRPPSGRFGSMICGTRSGRGWLRPTCRCARCRSGWATGIYKTTLIYADYAPGEHEVDLVNGAFASTNPSTSLSTTRTNSNPVDPVNKGGIG